MNSRLLFALGFLVCALPAAAQNPAPDRSAQFAALPNWAGLWEGDVAHETRSPDFGKVVREALAHPERLPTVAPPGVLDPEETFLISRTQLAHKPPYNPAWSQRYDADERSIKATPASRIKPGSIMACGWDFPEIMDNPFDALFQIFVTPEETLLLFANGQARHLYTDRPHPAAEDLWPSALGNSVAHWQNDTLIVDTIDRRAGPFIRIPFILSPDLSAQTHFTEQIRLIDADTLQDDMTIEDADRLLHPWTVTLKFHRVKDLDRLIPTDCTENNRFRVIGGKYSIAPTN